MSCPRIFRFAPLASCTAALAVMAGHAGAQCAMSKLMHADRAGSDGLGGAMSMSAAGSGPLVAVGMPSDDHAAGLGAGSVRFFQRLNNTWGEATWLTLQAADAGAGHHFGRSVSYRDPYLIVGSPDGGASGAAYIYKRFGSSWTQEAKITPPGSGTGDQVGHAVAVSGNWAIVGAPTADFDGSPNAGVSDPNSGAAYFYQRQPNGTWTLAQTVRDAGSGVFAYLAADDRLGAAVDIDGDVAVVGIGDGENINWPENHGYIHTYRRSGNNTWENDNDVLYVAPGTVQADDHFGASVSVDGTVIAIGAPDDDASPGEIDVGSSAKVNSGCVYFRRYHSGAWSWDGRVMPPDASDNARFGASVILRGNRCLITAPGARKAYIYQRSWDGWVLMNTIRDPDAGFSAFGSAGAFDGEWAAVGDTLDSDAGVAGGGAIYTVAPATSYGDSCDAALEIVSQGSVVGCTSLAQMDAITTCGGGGASGYGPDVWILFNASCTGEVTFDTEGSSFDTVLSIHSGCPGGGGSNTLACDDDSGQGTTSLVTMNVSRAQSLLIRVSGYNGASGNFVLNITYNGAPTNDTCAAPTAVVSGGQYAISTCNANSTPGLGSACLPASSLVNDVWFRFDAPAATGTLKLDTCGSMFDTVLSLYNTGSCPSIANEIACDDDSSAGDPCGASVASSISTSIQGGFPYLIRVSGYFGTWPIGEGVLRVNYIPNCRCDYNASGSLSVQDIFDFLTAYFSGNADFNASGGTTVQDIFDFLACYFAGCP